MAESALGEASTTRRQSSGSLAYAAASPRIQGGISPGGLKGPAATSWAEKIFAWGRASLARPAQRSAGGDAAPAAAARSAAPVRGAMRYCMATPLRLERERGEVRVAVVVVL